MRSVSFRWVAIPGRDGRFSVELCGGTHAARTGDIGLVALVNEGAVAAGVRRLEAKTGDAARRHLREEAGRARATGGCLRSPPDEAVERLQSLVEERRQLERELADARKRLAMGGGGKAADSRVRDVGGVKLFARTVTGIEMKDLKSLADEAKASVGVRVVAIVGRRAGWQGGPGGRGDRGPRGDRFNAVALVRAGAAKLGGKGGGGRPDMAQAGGPDGAKAEAALRGRRGRMAAGGRPPRDGGPLAGSTSAPRAAASISSWTGRSRPTPPRSWFTAGLIALVFASVVAIVLEFGARPRPSVRTDPRTRRGRRGRRIHGRIAWRACGPRPNTAAMRAERPRGGGCASCSRPRPSSTCCRSRRSTCSCSCRRT